MTKKANTIAMQMHNTALLDELESCKSKLKCLGDSSLSLKDIEKRIYDIEAEMQSTVYVTQYLYSDTFPFEVVEIVSPSTWIIRKMNFEYDSETGVICNLCSDTNCKLITIRRSKRNQSLFYEPKSDKSIRYIVSKEPIGCLDQSSIQKQ